MYDNQISNPDYCVKSYAVDKQVIDTMWCILWVPVIRRDLVDTESSEIISSAFSDWSNWVWRWIDCGSTAGTSLIDPEVVSVSNDWGETVIKAVIVYDTSVNPPVAVMYDQALGWIITGYTIVPDATSRAVVEWGVRCDAGNEIIPFYLVEADWTPSASVSFWLDPIANAVVVPSGLQTYGSCNIVPSTKVGTPDYYVGDNGPFLGSIIYDWTDTPTSVSVISGNAPSAVAQIYFQKRSISFTGTITIGQTLEAFIQTAYATFNKNNVLSVAILNDSSSVNIEYNFATIGITTTTVLKPQWAISFGDGSRPGMDDTMSTNLTFTTAGTATVVIDEFII